jgi:CBS domain-containing protein
MSTYRMVYGDDEQVVRETLDDVEVAQEDGWTVVFRGRDAILRVRNEHVQSLERLEPAADVAARRMPIQLTVRDLMRPAVTSVDRDAHLAAAAYLMKQADDTALVVIDDPAHGKPVAMITDADIARAVADGRNPEDVRISEVALRSLITVAPETAVAAAAELMLSSHIRHLPVVSGGRTIGMVDIGDACRGLIDEGFGRDG